MTKTATKKKPTTKKAPAKKSTRRKNARPKASDTAQESPSKDGDSSTEDSPPEEVEEGNSSDTPLTNRKSGNTRKKTKKSPTKKTPKKGTKPKGAKTTKKVPKKKTPASDDDTTPYCDPDDPEIVYSQVNVIPFFGKRYNDRSGGPLTVDQAKEFLGWQEESQNISFKSDYLFKDRKGRKVRCTNNLHNRPFSVTLAWKWMIEILRKKWMLNGESIIIDCAGMVQDGQHRLIGLVWAAQEWELHPHKWQKYWKTEPTIDTLIVTGVANDDETINTMNTGKPRSFADALYRSGLFADYNQKNRQRVSRIGQSAVKLLWRRTGQKELSVAYHMPHSEAFEFVHSHPHICDSIRHVFEEDGSANKINGYVPAGEAAAMLYLMAVSDSDRDTYVRNRCEDGLDVKHFDKACDFWTLIANQSSKVEPLLDHLLSIPEEIITPVARNVRIGHVVKAWDLFSRNKKITQALTDLEVSDEEPPYLREYPEFGGIDIGDEGILEEGGEVDEEA